MTIHSIVGVTPDVVGLAMDVNMLRQAVTAHNIANANSPGFQPSTVDFDTAMARLREDLADTASVSDGTRRAGALPAASLLEAQPGQVSLDQEIVRMNQIAVHYQALARGLSRYFSLMSLAATEGKR